MRRFGCRERALAPTKSFIPAGVHEVNIVSKIHFIRSDRLAVLTKKKFPQLPSSKLWNRELRLSEGADAGSDPDVDDVARKNLCLWHGCRSRGLSQNEHGRCTLSDDVCGRAESI